VSTAADREAQFDTNRTLLEGQRMASTRQNVVDLFGGEGKTVTGEFKIRDVEDATERRSRLAIEEAKAAHDLWKDKLIHVAIIVVIGVVSCTCLAIVAVPGFPEKSSVQAFTILTAVVSAGFGHMTGRASRPTP